MDLLILFQDDDVPIVHAALELFPHLSLYFLRGAVFRSFPVQAWLFPFGNIDGNDPFDGAVSVPAGLTLFQNCAWGNRRKRPRGIDENAVSPGQGHISP